MSTPSTSTRSIRKAGSATALVAAGLIAGGVLAGSLTANAATSPSPSAGSSSSEPQSNDTHVTGAQADQVISAVKAKYSGSSITTVRADRDGSFDALGTDSSGNPVRYDVSADLKTITAGGAGPRGFGGPGGRGGPSNDTPVTGAEADKVKAAVTETFSGTTISTVRKDPDGSYDALGTDGSGNPVFYNVSTDLTTITAGGFGHGGPQGAPPAAGTTTPNA